MADTPLASVSQLGAYIQQTLADDDPSALLMLEIASGMVRDFLDNMQLTYVGEDVVTLDPINGSFVLLPELPVGQVTLVEILTAGTWTTLDPSAYTVSRSLGMLAGLPGCGINWPTTPESWRVTYSHGYQTIPSGLVGIVVGVAARAYSSPAGVDSERIGGYQVKYAMEADGFTGLERKALARYRRPAVA